MMTSAPLRAVATTEGLLAAPVASVGAHERVAVRDRLLTAVPPLVASLPDRARLTLDTRLLSAPDHGTEWSSTRSFCWRPVFARRSLGLAALAACQHGRFATPAQAVPVAASDAVDVWRRTGRRALGWEEWFARLGPGGQAAVLAEASTWASVVWTSLDWDRLADALVGGPDDQWNCTAGRAVVLRGRADVRVPLPDGSTALVVVHGGVPTRLQCEALGLPALVASLRYPSRPVPARVLGLWPDAGEVRTLEVAADVLAETAEQVIEVLSALATARADVPDGAD